MLRDNEKNFIINFIINNPISKYPLINNYYLFYNFIIDKFLKNIEKLNIKDKKFFESISPKYNYENINKIGEENAKAAILNSPSFSFQYVKDLSNKVKNLSNIDDVRWREGEWIISRSPYYSASYLNEIIYPALTKLFKEKKSCLRVIKEKFSIFEDSIIKDPSATLIYVKGVIKDIYPRGEKILLSDDFVGEQYINSIVYDSILNTFKGDHQKTREEIRKRYSDFDKMIISKVKDYYDEEAVEKYLEKIVYYPNKEVENEMVKAGKALQYFEFLKKYYHAIEIKNNVGLSKEDIDKNVINSIINNVISDVLVDMAKNYIRVSLISKDSSSSSINLKK